jgi:glutathione peroxidase-family protein
MPTTEQNTFVLARRRIGVVGLNRTKLFEGWCAATKTRILQCEDIRGQNVHSFLLQKEPSVVTRLLNISAPEEMAAAKTRETL